MRVGVMRQDVRPPRPRNLCPLIRCREVASDLRASFHDGTEPVTVDPVPRKMLHPLGILTEEEPPCPEHPPKSIGCTAPHRCQRRPGQNAEDDVGAPDYLGESPTANRSSGDRKLAASPAWSPDRQGEVCAQTGEYRVAMGKAARTDEYHAGTQMGGNRLRRTVHFRVHALREERDRFRPSAAKCVDQRQAGSVGFRGNAGQCPGLRGRRILSIEVPEAAVVPRGQSGEPAGAEGGRIHGEQQFVWRERLDPAGEQRRAQRPEAPGPAGRIEDARVDPERAGTPGDRVAAAPLTSGAHNGESLASRRRRQSRGPCGTGVTLSTPCRQWYHP